MLRAGVMEKRVCAGFAGLLLVLILVYVPGLSGPFLLDDFPNLETLYEAPVGKPGTSIPPGVLDGPAGPLGRPLALLSFYLNDWAWPSDPYAFKRTNVLLHGLNFVLLFACCIGLTSSLGLRREQVLTVSLLASALWAFAALQVSTVLYVVQRMTILSTTFVLCGIIAYLRGRDLLLRGRLVGALCWMGPATALAMLLSILSKESGLLLPVYLLVIESCLLRTRVANMKFPDGVSKWIYRPYYLLCLWGSLLLILAYLLSLLGDIASVYDPRSYSFVERVSTQPGVVLEYLRLLLVPASHTSNVFYDNYPLQTTFMAPGVWLPAGVLLLITIAALVVRRRLAPLATAVLFFLAGHLLESTIVPLEVYFEHRNYAPSLMLYLPLAWYALVPDWRRYRRWLVLLLLAYLALQAVMASFRVQIWQSQFGITHSVLLDNPGALRARIYHAGSFQAAGDFAGFIAQVEQGITYHPDNERLRAWRLYAACYGLDHKDDIERMLRSSMQLLRQRTRWQPGRPEDQKFLRMIPKVVGVVATGQCPPLPEAGIREWLLVGLQNPATRAEPAVEQLFLWSLGILAVYQEDHVLAMEYLRRAVQLRKDAESSLYAVVRLANSGRETDARELLRLYFSLYPPRDAGTGRSAAANQGAGQFEAELLQLQQELGPE